MPDRERRYAAEMTEIKRFEDRASPLLDIIRAHQSGEKDWPETKAALMAFQFVNPSDRGPQPEFGTPEWATWYNETADIGGDDPPGSWMELLMAQTLGMISGEKVDELSAERFTFGKPSRKT